MRHTLLTASFFRVDEITVSDRHGGERKRQIVVHPGAAVVLPRLDSERIILIRNVREAVDRELLELPAGKLDANEDAETCARRELEEETGYRCGRISRLCEFFPSPGILTEKLYAFVAEDLTEVGQKLEAGERIAPVFTTLDEAMDMIRERRIEDGKTLITLMMFDLLGRRC
ncbi:MAG: NUDIX hydrolase [Phycisphaerales bacterium]|nr:MAG: NUDIX hydrolase [Phycisphaerales bacterium]